MSTAPGVQHDVYHPLHVLLGPCTEFFFGHDWMDAYMTWMCLFKVIVFRIHDTFPSNQHLREYVWDFPGILSKYKMRLNHEFYCTISFISKG